MKPQSNQLQARGISPFSKPVIMGLIWSKDELDRCCCDIKLCIIASKRLEHILESHFNASGRGLHEKINSAGSLPEPVWVMFQSLRPPNSAHHVNLLLQKPKRKLKRIATILFGFQCCC
jgi:hypothetical protein